MNSGRATSQTFQTDKSRAKVDFMTLEHEALPPIVDQQTWRAALDDLRKREKAATRELDAIAAERRRLPMVELPDYTLIGVDGPVRLVDVFDGRSQLIAYHHMWSDGAEWQCGGGAGFPSAVNVFLRDGDTVYRTWHTNGRGTEQLSHSFGLIDILPWGRQEEWLDSPQGWPSRPTYSGWVDSPDI